MGRNLFRCYAQESIPRLAGLDELTAPMRLTATEREMVVIKTHSIKRGALNKSIGSLRSSGGSVKNDRDWRLTHASATTKILPCSIVPTRRVPRPLRERDIVH